MEALIESDVQPVDGESSGAIEKYSSVRETVFSHQSDYEQGILSHEK